MVICPFCDQGVVYKAKVREFSEEIYICGECDTVWESSDLSEEKCTRFDVYMNKRGHEGVWSELTEYKGEYLSDLENTVTSLGMKWITKKVISVTLFRDKVIWLEEGEKWKLDIESGISIHFEDNTDLILFARDSSLGLMDFWLGKDVSWLYQPDQIAELYMIDKSNIQEVSREERSLS